MGMYSQVETTINLLLSAKKTLSNRDKQIYYIPLKEANKRNILLDIREIEDDQINRYNF